MHCNKFINYPNSISGPIDPRDDENMTELARVEQNTTLEEELAAIKAVSNLPPIYILD